MSPQQALRATKSSTVYQISHSGMSNSQLAQAADESFSLHQRLDTNLTAQSALASNPLNSPANNKQCFQLGKRKISLDSVPLPKAAAPICYNTDFVSGIFQDLQESEACVTAASSMDCDDLDSNIIFPTDSDNLNPPRPSKKMKLTKSKTFYRRKSYSNLLSASNDLSHSEPYSHTHQVSLLGDSNTSQSRVLADDDTEPVNEHADAPDELLVAQIVDQVLIDALTFPRLPATVSESSCTSNNLTRTSMPAAQVNETTPTQSNNTEGEKHVPKDSYGWFVDMDDTVDDNLDSAEEARRKCRADTIAKDDLSFAAAIAPKRQSELEDEVEWAKAADTVDDVLGDLF